MKPNNRAIQTTWNLIMALINKWCFIFLCPVALHNNNNILMSHPRQNLHRKITIRYFCRKKRKKNIPHFLNRPYKICWFILGWDLIISTIDMNIFSWELHATFNPIWADPQALCIVWGWKKMDYWLCPKYNSYIWHIINFWKALIHAN